MAPKHVLAAALLLCGGSAYGQQGAPQIVQPGAPGQPSKILTSVAAAPAPKAPSQADVRFLQDMIMHHGQAVEMTELAKTRASHPDVKGMAEKIDLSQTTEIQFMKQWLADRGIALDGPMGDMAGMPGMSQMDHSKMAGMGQMDHSQMAGMDHRSATGSGKDSQDVAMMPGMLTPRQMKTLSAASGAKFDELFLTGMMQHHSGALLMVKELMATAGAAQDPSLFDFAQDVDNGQLAEINIMQSILRKVKP